MKVLIFQPMLKFYRVPLFEKMHEILSKRGHELRLVFGSPWEEELKRNDNVVVRNDYSFYERSHWLFNNKVHLLENSIKHILWADIVITEQANKHVHNYFLIFFRLINLTTFAYWGHGLNRQGEVNSISEKIKRFLVTEVDWWFAYTIGVARYLRAVGFPENRITVLNNSTDTRSLKAELNKVSSEDVAKFKSRHGIAKKSEIGVFCGSLHKEKKIEFLLDCAIQIKRKRPNFLLLIGGSGEANAKVLEYSARHEFIVYLGPLHGLDKAMAFKAADVFINPGMIGLAILDAFAAGLPVFTTAQASHSPEIDYLINGENGLISDLDIAKFSDSVANVFSDPPLLKQLKINASNTSEEYSIEKMAENFATGIDLFKQEYGC